ARVELRCGGFHLIMALHLPCAVIDIVEHFDAFGADTAGLGNRCAGGDAATQRACVDLFWLPFRGYSLPGRERFGLAAICQLQVHAAAKARWPDALNMTVTDE